MKVFKEKTYASTEAAKKAGQSFGQMIKEGAIKGAANPIAIASLGVGGTGLYMNYMTKKATERRNEQADEQHRQAMRQNERLIRALGGVERGLAAVPQRPIHEKSSKKDDSWLKIGGRKIFSEKKEKTYGEVTRSAMSGAMYGAGIGAIASPFVKGPNFFVAKSMGTLIGGALGAIAGSVWGITKTIDQKMSQSQTGHSLITEVTKNLDRAGLKKGTDWTTDPKISDKMRTKVVMVISRRADELGVLINMQSDPKLKRVSEEVIENLPKDTRKTEKVSDKFNEIQVTSLPGNQDPVYIAEIAKGFIKRGFPVYLMEVG